MEKVKNGNKINNNTTAQKAPRERIDRDEQKRNLLKRFPDALLFIANSRLGESLFKSLRFIDVADEVILRQWGYGNIDNDTVKEWNMALAEFKNQAQKLQELGIASVAKSKDVGFIPLAALRKEIDAYKENQNKEK
ncbi:MAG: hypothetical protein KN64_00715 [Sulfurovum sp. AS07-7]|nr:MAG: hypothetical protein KN64_00715 [Sulfurovum sp. AS07-7]